MPQFFLGHVLMSIYVLKIGWGWEEAVKTKLTVVVSVEVQSPASAGEPELGVDERHGDLVTSCSLYCTVLYCTVLYCDLVTSCSLCLTCCPWSLVCAVRPPPDYCLSPHHLPELLATYQRGAGPGAVAHTFMCHRQQLTLNMIVIICWTLYPAIYNLQKLTDEDGR